MNPASRLLNQTARLATLACLLWCISTLPASATRLLMFESSTCEWCERWHEEIGSAYPKTWLGRVAPLQKISIDGKRPEQFKSIRAIVYTPTFVLWHNGKEVGRMVGYPGEIFFWPLLEKLITRLPATARRK